MVVVVVRVRVRVRVRVWVRVRVRVRVNIRVNIRVSVRVRVRYNVRVNVRVVWIIFYCLLGVLVKIGDMSRSFPPPPFPPAPGTDAIECCLDLLVMDFGDLIQISN